jgi:DNA repair photolyase
MASTALVGIARMAQQARTLETKARVEYREIAARSLLNRCTGGRMPFEWTVNPYRGCEFGCKYCYARYTHEFMELREPEDFERRIFAKAFGAAEFGRELRQVKQGEWIAIGTATDPYQPAERRYGVTRRVLEVFARRGGFKLALTTKSDLVARDAALLSEIGRRNTLRVNLTVTTLDTELARAMEPMAPRPDLRLRAVRALSEAGVTVRVFASPVMPGLNDSRAAIEAVAKAAHEAGAAQFGANALFLKPCALRVFLPFLAVRYPWLARAYASHFRRGVYLRRNSTEDLERIVAEMRSKYGLEAGGAEAVSEWGQMDLFATEGGAS